MTAVLIIMLALALLFLLKISLHAIYAENGFSLYSEILGIRIKILPSKKKAKDKKKEKKKRLSVNERLQTVKIIIKTLGKVKHIILFEKVRIKYIAASDNPFNTVQKYNAVNAIVASAIPYFEGSFRVGKGDILIDTDMTAEKSVIEFEIKLSIRAGEILYLGIFSGTDVLKLLLSRRAAERGERKACYGEQTQ